MKNHSRKIDEKALRNLQNIIDPPPGPFTIETDRYKPTTKVNGVRRDPGKRKQPRFAPIGFFGLLGIALLALKDFFHFHNFQFEKFGDVCWNNSIYWTEIKLCSKCPQRRAWFGKIGLPPQDLQ